MNHNRKHFKEAFSSKIHKNQTCELLPNNSIRDTIFNGALDENYCGDEDVRKFLKFLQDKGSSRRTNHRPLTKLEYENIVKKAKENSASSVFSHRKLYNV